MTRLATSLHASHSFSACFFCSVLQRGRPAAARPTKPCFPSGHIRIFRQSSCLDFQPRATPPSSLLPPRHDIQKIQPPKWPRNQPSPRSRALGGRMPPPRASRPGPGLGGRDNLPAGSPPFVTKIRAILPSSQSPPLLTQIRATLPSSQATIARLSTTTPMVTATRGSMWVPGSISSRSCRQMRRWTRAWAEWARRRNPRCFARLSAGWSHQRSRRSRGNSGDSWTVVCGWRSTIFRRPTPRSLRNPR